jgi:hypothetical protein
MCNPKKSARIKLIYIFLVHATANGSASVNRDKKAQFLMKINCLIADAVAAAHTDIFT